MKIRVFQIHCMPLTSNHFVYPPLNKINYEYYILDISNIFFKKERLYKYRYNSKFKKYSKCIYINIRNKNDLIIFINKKINNKSVFLFDDIISVDIFWLLKYLKKINQKYYLPYKVAQLVKTKSIYNKISDSFFSLKYIKYAVPRIPLIIKRLLYKKTLIYQKPDILFTPGNSHEYWIKNIKPKKIISINSPQILNINSKKFKRLIYVDEFQIFNRDNALFNFKPIISDIDKYYLEINNFLTNIEYKYGIKIIICCSNKHFYKKNPYNFEIIYGKTNKLISSSEFVLGHDSDVLFQAVYSQSKILLINSNFQLKIKNQKAIEMAKLIGCKTLNISKYNDEKIISLFQKPKKREILQRHFLKSNNYKESHIVTVAKNIYLDFM